MSRRWSRGESERLVGEFEQSGVGAGAFCKVHGIAQHTLDNYRRKHGGGEQPGGRRPLPVELVESASSRSWCLRVELANGRWIAVEEGFDAMLLKRLVAALEA